MWKDIDWIYFIERSSNSLKVFKWIQNKSKLCTNLRWFFLLLFNGFKINRKLVRSEIFKSTHFTLSKLRKD